MFDLVLRDQAVAGMENFQQLPHGTAQSQKVKLT